MITRRQMEETEARYAARSEQREDMRRKVAAGRLLEVDEPERVRKRLARLAPAAGALAEPGARAAVVGADLVGLERLVGGSQLMGAEFLTRGVAVARSVARVVVGTQRGLVDTYGTGVLVSPRLLMTNHHVLAHLVGDDYPVAGIPEGPPTMREPGIPAGSPTVRAPGIPTSAQNPGYARNGTRQQAARNRWFWTGVARHRFTLALGRFTRAVR